MVVFCPAGPPPVKWTNSRARSSMERRGHATGVAHGPRRVPMTATRRSGPTLPRALRPRCWYRPTCWMVSRPTSQTSRPLRLCRPETARLRMMAGGTDGASAGAPEHRNPFLMPEAEAAVMRAPAKRWFSRLGARAVITRLIAWPELLTRPVAGRPHATRRGLLAVVAVSACAAVVTGIAVHTGTHPGSDPSQSTQSAAAIASLDRLSGTSLHITLRPAQRSRTRPSKAHTNRAGRPRSHPTLVSRVTAVAARYTTPPTRTSGTTSTSAPAVEGGSTTSSSGSSAAGSTASSTPTASSSRPTAHRHSTTQAFGAGGVLGPGSSPNG